MLNYRCPTDIPYNPVAHAYLVLTSTRCIIFVDERKVQNEELRERWKSEDVETRPYGVNDVGECVKEMSEDAETSKDEKAILQVWSRLECSWALSKACYPVILPSICTTRNFD